MPNPKEHAEARINPLFRIPNWHIGDPPIILEAILAQVEGEQAKQVTALYLDSVSASLEANLKFVRGVRSLVAGGKGG